MYCTSTLCWVCPVYCVCCALIDTFFAKLIDLTHILAYASLFQICEVLIFDLSVPYVYGGLRGIEIKWFTV